MFLKLIQQEAALPLQQDREVYHSVKDILTAADWSRETTFNRFNDRPRHSVSFGTAVIS